VVGGLYIRVSRAELFDKRSLLFVEFVWLAHAEPGSSTWRHAAFGRGLWWEGTRGADRTLSRGEFEGHGDSCDLMLRAHLGHKVAKQRIRTGIAELFDFFQELRAVPAPRLPTFEDVGLVEVEDAPTIGWPTAFRKYLSLQKLTYRVT
jgi:hypothetical protein